MTSKARLAGKVAIVTGAASGIGAETARTFALHGAVVLLCDMQDAAGQRQAAGIAAEGGMAEYHHLDVTSEAGWLQLVAEAERRHGAVDVLANIAGIAGMPYASEGGPAPSRALADQTLETWNRVMAVNATGTFLGTRAMITPMQRAGGGSIINMASICAIVGSFGTGPYHASKGAVRLLSKAAAVEYGADRIRVNTVHPGFIDTPMARPSTACDDRRGTRIAATPLGRLGTASDVAMACLYLASDESAFVTGCDLVIDGGMTAV